MQLQDFLEGLRVEVELVRAGLTDAQRIADLTQHTSAFNLAPVHRDQAACAELLELGETELWMIKVRDRLDDYGVTGVLGATARGRVLVVDTLLLSCRVLGKGVEQRLLARLADIAEQRACADARFRYMRTAKNGMAGDFIRKLAASATKETDDGVEVTVPIAALRAAGEPAVARPAATRARAGGSFSITSFLQSRWNAVSPAERHEIMGALGSLRREEQLLAAIAGERHRTRPTAAMTFVAPRTPLEEVIAGVWAEVLGVERVGAHDHFFQLGGHSLQVLQIISRLRDLLDIELVLQDVFKTPTVATLAAAISSTPAEEQRLDQMAQLILSVTQLSDEDVEVVLSQRAPPAGRP